MIEFKNETDLEFTDISSEDYREYVFADVTIRIDKPRMLNVSRNGHRVWDEEGVSHYIPHGWKHLHWKATNGPHFVR